MSLLMHILKFAGPYSIATVLVLTAPIACQPAYAQTERLSDLYDRPVATTRQAVRSQQIEAGGGLICYDYEHFMVKRLDSGSPTGDVSVMLVPATGRDSPIICGMKSMPGEIGIKGDGFSFSGVRGHFLIMEASDPNGAEPFKIYNRRTASLLYSDATDGNGLKFIAEDGDNLHIRFRRGINGTCSIPKDGEACWAKIGREAHFPNAIGRLPAPVGSCIVNCRQQKAPVDDPSALYYDVDLIVAPQGRTTVLSRGEISCEPMP